MFSLMFSLALALLAQAAPSSMLVRPLELGPTIPPTHAVALLRVRVEDPAATESSAELAQRLLAAVRPESFVAFVSTYEQRPTRDVRGALGTFSRAMLDPEVAAAVFDAHSEQSGPLVGTDGGVYHVRRIERDAACRQVLVAGTDGAARERATALVRELRAGGDFAALARERSDDPASALRGGDLAIYERGRRDALLRAAAFEMSVGEVVGPVETPLGFHVLQRVGVEALAPSLRDDAWARVRGLLVAFSGAQGARSEIARDHDEAEALADELATRVRCGEDIGALAALHDDDRGGRERRGDLGWVRRGTTQMPQFFDAVFLEPPGTLIGPIATRMGFVLLRREDSGPRTQVEVRRSALAELERWVTLGREDDARHGAARTALAQLARGATSREELAQALVRLNSSQELAAWSALRAEPERELALGCARALAALEPPFLQEHWPARARSIDSALGLLRERQVAAFDAALDTGLRELRVADPRSMLRFALVTEGADAGVTAETLSVGDATSMFEALLSRVLLRASARDIESTPVLAALRAAFGARASFALEAVVRAEAGSITRRAFRSESAGVLPADPLAARLASTWLSHVERGEPLDATLAALAALAR
ncbi:MAG: hypothetical protein FJ298_01845 [Planctomycetes bacterium]|nr:hypothetical protein [Planctomycetota bacterium]